METITKSILVLSILAFSFISCEKEDFEKEVDIHFKMGSDFTSGDIALPGGTAVKIGIEADTEKEKDPLIKFNISESINGGATSTIYSQDIETTEYEYDYNFIMDTVSGNIHTYTFTVTNRDGFNKQASLKITVQ